MLNPTVAVGSAGCQCEAQVRLPLWNLNRKRISKTHSNKIISPSDSSLVRHTSHTNPQLQWAFPLLGHILHAGFPQRWYWALRTVVPMWHPI